MSKLLLLLNCIYFSLLLLCIIIGVLSWNRLGIKYRVFTVFIFITLLIELTALLFAKFLAVNRTAYFLYDIFNAVFISWFWYSTLDRVFLKRVVIVSGAALLCLLLIIGVSGNYGTFGNLYTCIANTVFIIDVFVFLLEKMIDPAETYIWKKSEFIYSLNLLFFSSVGVLFWIANTYFANGNAKVLIQNTYYTFLGANYLYYIGIAIVFIRESKNSHES